MTTCYLEVDDEITGAIARIRAVRDGEAVIVVPPGSRIATSRINFKLLAREGNERRLNIVAVSDDPAVRALAIAAGLPAYDTVPAAEKALASFREQDRRLAQRLGRVDDAEATRVLPVPPAPSGRTPSGARSTTEVQGDRGEREERRRRRIGLAPLAGAAILLLLLAGVGYGAYVLLPTATITLQPRVTPVTQQAFTVTADPDVAVSDVSGGVVPAQRLEIPVSVGGTFDATGVQVRETRATGTVRFRSENTLNDVTLQEGTVVSTADGEDFETTQAAVIPRADFTTSTPGTVDVPVRASRPGPRGNVDADSIIRVNAGLAGQLVSVRNREAITGGRRTEERVVQQSDWDAALTALHAQLESALAAELNDPETTPQGLTLFLESAQTGTPEIEPGAETVIGSVAETFALTMNSTASVTAVNEGLVDELAAERIRSTLPDGQLIVGDEVQASRSAGVVDRETVVYDVGATAQVFSDPNLPALVALVRGKSIAEAESILAPYGMVDIAIWPEFVDRLPDQTARISLVVVTPSARP